MSLRITIAAPYRHLHRDRLRRSEFVHYLAHDRMWVNPDQAKVLIDLAVSEGLLAVEEGFFVPLFSLDEVTVPLGYRPGSEDLEPPDPERVLRSRIMAAIGQDEREVAAEANRIAAEQFDGALRPQAALVLLARRHGVPFEDLVASLRDALLKE